ncbi:MAG TPA: VCBS repeat-containing protein [Candidatus Paceibacterota bacterium]|nr:VCBS repeat-containing protein [Candidatus Paceibacterota bacterium]
MISLKRLHALAAGFLGFSSLMLQAQTNSGFSFGGPEIFPIDPLISQLHVADIDGDRLNDIVVVNNSRSKITILYNQTGKTNQVQKAVDSKREMNELPPDARFRIESIASEKRIASLVVTDLNGDGRPDIGYYGEPKELVVQYNEGTNNWSAPRRWPINNGQLSPNALATGDLNGDGRADLVLLSENCVYFLPQLENHTLGEPQKIPLSGTVKSVQVLDVDGDKRDDLMLVNWEDRNPFRFRLQKADGELGPEIYFTMPPIRSYWADNLEQNGKVQVMTIAQNSGRAQVSEFVRKPAEQLSGNFLRGQFQVLPLNKTDKAKRGLLWADVDGDGLPDLLVAEPESGQISICLQQKDGLLANPRTFPTLAGVTDLAVGDWEGDGKPEIFMLSGDERQVGVTRLDEKLRLPFPTLIPVDGRPLAIAVGPLQGAKSALTIIVDQDGKRSLVTRTSDGRSRVQKLSESFKSNPSSISIQDVDQDGLADIVALIPYEKIKVLRQVAGKDFEEIDVAPPGGAMEQPWLCAADVDGDGKAELLLPQKNFLRAVVMQSNSMAQSLTNKDKASWTFKVKEQINGAASDSRIIGAAAVPNGTNAVASLFLLDAERKALTLCERDHAGVWQVVRNIELPVSGFGSLQPVALGGSAPNGIALLGLNTVAWMSLTGQGWELSELDGYETPIKNGYLNDVTSGDLNNDGRKDLIFLETGRNYLDLVMFSSDHKLVPANRWQVFEERTFRSRRTDSPEPREAAVADVTGDRKNDLIVVVHDRVLVYPQE